MNNRELVVLSFEKAYQNVQNKSLSIVIGHLYRKSVEFGYILNKKTLKRHYNHFILTNKNAQLYADAIDFYYKFLEIANEAEFKEKYKLQITQIDVVVEKLKKLTQPNTKTIDNDHIENKPDKKEIVKSVKNLLNKTNYFIIASIALVSIALYWFKKPQPLINIENFNIGTQYYYTTDANGHYVISTNPDLHNAQPLTPKVFDAYFQQQGIDTVNPELKFIKANYFYREKRITDHQVINDVNFPRNKINKPTNGNTGGGGDYIEVIMVQFENETNLKPEIIGLLNDAYAPEYEFVDKKNTNYDKIGNVKSTINYQAGTLVPNTVVCHFTLNISVIDKYNNSIEFQKSTTVNAIGFSETEALQNAFDKLKSQLL